MSWDSIVNRKIQRTSEYANIGFQQLAPKKKGKRRKTFNLASLQIILTKKMLSE